MDSSMVPETGAITAIDVDSAVEVSNLAEKMDISEGQIQTPSEELAGNTFNNSGGMTVIS